MVKIPGLPRRFDGDPMAFVEGQLAAGEFPDLEVLGQAITEAKDGAIPIAVRMFLAKLLEGRLKRPHGRPVSAIDAQIERRSAEFLRYSTKGFIAMMRLTAQREGHRPEKYETLKSIALDHVATSMGIAPSTLEKMLFPRKRKARK